MLIFSMNEIFRFQRMRIGMTITVYVKISQVLLSKGIRNVLIRSVAKSAPVEYQRLIYCARASLGVMHESGVNHTCIEEQLVKLQIQVPIKVKMENINIPHQILL